MKLEILNQEFSICKLEDISKIDYLDEIYFVSKTDEELSLVCRSDKVPDNAIECDPGWKAFRIHGLLDFSLIGILSRISLILANNGIGIFTVSTYNTDYILTKTHDFDRAIEVLENYEYEVV